VKELLSHAGVPFITRNVELDLEAYRDLMARGFRSVPVTIVGDDPDAVAVIGFDESKLKRALDIE
jgi:hypothetical protein